MRITSSSGGLFALACVGSLALAGCGGSSAPPSATPSAPGSESQAAASTSSGDCATVDAPMSSISSQGAAEPQLRIPQPQGWERNTKMDSEIIRYVLANVDLVAESFAPNAVVTLEKVPGTSVPPQSILDQQRAGLVAGAGATDLSVTPGTVCGLPAETVKYTLPARGQVAAHPATVLIVAAPIGADTWSATVTVQTVDPDNATYQQDSSTILAGFQMVPPEDSAP